MSSENNERRSSSMTCIYSAQTVQCACKCQFLGQQANTASVSWQVQVLMTCILSHLETASATIISLRKCQLLGQWLKNRRCLWTTNYRGNLLWLPLLLLHLVCIWCHCILIQMPIMRLQLQKVPPCWQLEFH